MKMRLLELQNDNKEAKKLWSEGLLEGWEDIEEVLYYQSFLTIGQYYNKTLRSMSRAVTFAWY